MQIDGTIVWIFFSFEVLFYLAEDSSSVTRKELTPKSEDSSPKAVLCLCRIMSSITYLRSSRFPYPFPRFLGSLERAQQALPTEIMFIHYYYLESTSESTIYSPSDYSYSKSLKLLAFYFSNFVLSKKINK